MWKPQRHPFKVTRHGRPIDTAPLKEAIDTGIAYSMEYAEYDACVSCGLDLWKWANRQYPKRFMAKVVAFHQERMAVRNHAEDAARKK